MLKVLYFTSETKKKFGIFRVINALKKKQGNNLRIKLSNNILDIFNFNPQVIHIHGCWQPKLLLIFLIGKIISKKIVISPHGMIDPLSFNQKKTKKKLAWFLYQKHIFNFSNLIIVNSKLEKLNLTKKIKLSKKIKIIKHGVTIQKKNIKTKKKDLRFVFFSRIHPSKNLLKLVEIWKNNYFFKKYNLDIYGKVENFEYYNKIKKKIKNLKNVKYKGSINNNLGNKLSNYDIFLHPSESENFGLVILEAMSCGLLPLVNKKLDWKILDKKKVGYSLKFDFKNLKKIIVKIDKSKKIIRQKTFQKKLKNFLLENFNWDLIILDYFNKYSKLVR